MYNLNWKTCNFRNVLFPDFQFHNGFNYKTLQTWAANPDSHSTVRVRIRLPMSVFHIWVNYKTLRTTEEESETFLTEIKATCVLTIEAFDSISLGVVRNICQYYVNSKTFFMRDLSKNLTSMYFK